MVTIIAFGRLGKRVCGGWQLDLARALTITFSQRMQEHLPSSHAL